MKVLKFGETSIGSVERIKEMVQLIRNQAKIVVVFPAMPGVADALKDISEYLYKKNPDGANELINQLEQQIANHISSLYEADSFRSKASALLERQFGEIRSYTNDLFTLFEERALTAQGVLISTQLIQLYLEEQNINSVLLPALEFMRTDKNAEPDPQYIKEKLSQLIETYPEVAVFVTQGSICRNAYGEVDNLELGGDYSASLIGVALRAEEIQIWSDVDTMLNKDPMYVKQTSPVRNLHYEEAAELAYFGAKILHPVCILPARLNHIPVRLLNINRQDALGTVISGQMDKGSIKAIAAKDNITMIRIKSGRMLLAYGFLRKVFEIFERYRTAIDLIVTSEVTVSVTIDNQKRLTEIVDELKKYGTVTIDNEMTIVCVVGDLKWNNVGFESQIINAFKNIPVHIISYGGSDYNVSFLIKSIDKKDALQALSDALF